MNETDLKQRIAQTLARFAHGSLRENGIALLNALGYRSERQIELNPNTFEGLAGLHPAITTINQEKALVKDWRSVDILFQLTGEDIRDVAQGHFVFDRQIRVDDQIIESYLFVAIELSHAEYTRSRLADLTREVNKVFKMPVMILLKHGDCLTLSIINRRLHKRDENRDVLEKVTLIKGIRYAAPIRAHVEILFDLSLYQLQGASQFHNFVELHQAWQKTLDTSELNKRFYREVANWYFWATNAVRFPTGNFKDEDTCRATNVIRLITRLIFVWFIKEKGLVPETLFDEARLKTVLKFNDPQGSTYYKAILQNLFFATLNTEMGATRRFRGQSKDPNGRDGHHGISTVYRYEDYFIYPAEALRLFAGIPFLNGGLFECLDKPEEKLRVDGFSDDPRNQPVVPDELFFGRERTVDLNEVYGDRRHGRERVRGLVHIFNSYKFTIEENTPLDEEIALDPELLGKVFENLLAAFNPETGTTARKQTGSFYTPREIVNYMVDEALVAYLEGKLADFGAADVQPRLRHLLAYNQEPHRFSQAEAQALIAAIDAVNVLDPACGSGAFPMGVLHKLVFILAKLDPGNRLWKQKQVDKAAEIPDPAVRERVIEDIEKSFEENELDYGRKLYLIENCIYGVDIQPIAVQIAKLRFFISLVVDQRVDATRSNLGIRPLPNLETRFVAANTLIGIQRPQQMMFRNPAIEQKEKQLAETREALFTARTPATKRKHREVDERLRNEIAALLKTDGWGSAAAEQLAAWDPYDQNASAGFFDPEWMFGISDGFDVVIGNPPYMRVQMIQKTQPEFMPYYRDHYSSAVGSFDLYAVFIEKGYSLLGENGQLAYIVPHKFFQATFGQGLRKLLTQHKALRQIVRFGAEQVFEEATTYTCLLFLSERANEQFDLIEVKSLERGEEALQAVRQREKHPDYAHETLAEPIFAGGRYGENVDWDFSLGESDRVLKRMQQHSEKLGDLTRKIFQGIATSADKIYVLEILAEKEKTYYCFSKQLGEEVEVEKGLVKPFLMGKDVHRYETVTAKNVVIFPYRIPNGKAELMTQSFIRDHFPLGWQYLKRNEKTLAEREHGRFARDWHSFSRPQNLTEFEAKKIMTPEIALGCQMTVDDKGIFYHTTKVYSFVFKDSVKLSLKYLLGLLNSKVLWFFLSSTGYVLRGGYYTFKTDYLKPFPIAESRPEQEQAVASLVDYVLFLKGLPESSIREEEARKRLMTAYFEQLIDALIFEIYFPEEFQDAGKLVSRLLNPDQLPPLEKMAGDQFALLQRRFKELYQPNHPVRKMVFFLDTIETVRVIEERSRGK